MVSFQSIEFENSTRKRKWEDQHHQKGLKIEELLDKPAAAKAKVTDNGLFDTELTLETRLPMEWQRCLDIKSGQVHYYNMMTQKRTSSDPRAFSNERDPLVSSNNVSLDLELHLPCGGDSLRKNSFARNNYSDSSSSENDKKNENSGSGLTRIPSWLASEGDQREMITAVCKKCHMLVMMCKSSPTCPNCKFVHPPDQNTPSLFKQRLSLLC